MTLPERGRRPGGPPIATIEFESLGSRAERPAPSGPWRGAPRRAPPAAARGRRRGSAGAHARPAHRRRAADAHRLPAPRRPAVLRAARRRRAAARAGHAAACLRSAASEFRGIRPHHPGEPLSRVDWKSTARTGNLMLREMDDPDEQRHHRAARRVGAVRRRRAAGHQLRARRAGGRLRRRLRPARRTRRHAAAARARAGAGSGSRRTPTDTSGCSRAWPGSEPSRAPGSACRCARCSRAATGRCARRRSRSSCSGSIASWCARWSRCAVTACACRVIHVDRRRSGRRPAGPSAQGLQLALAAAGVPCLTLATRRRPAHRALAATLDDRHALVP